MEDVALVLRPEVEELSLEAVHVPVVVTVGDDQDVTDRIVPETIGVFFVSPEGLLERVQKALGDRVIPVTFSPKTKSDLGWNFLAIVETGRYQDYADDQEPDTRQFWHEVETCQYQVREGPNKLLSWGVWDPPAYDGLIAHGHDDLLISAALCAILDAQPWPGTGPSTVVARKDPLKEIDESGWA